ncbi:F-box/LRR-repeat protein 5-like [Sycon ciliatum]|uniref:F-box/LRR-repeat protein 5-like n=1 Tax=Sycon ciliatum TaxID=27933 RepID=UPI0031F65FEB
MKASGEEVDVFNGPHARMRTLLDRMKVRLSNTDFRHRDSVATLLFELQYIFSEFKKHEEIEDTYIVDELKSRMTQGAQQRSLVGAATAPEASSLALATHTPEQHEQDAPISLEKDLHGDDRLTSVIHVISNVQDVTGRATCNRVVRLRQGQRLCEVLDEFTVDFVPHMAEEEQVFQPLLMRHFTALELIHLRDKVIQLHASNVRATSSVVSGPLSVQAWWSRGLPAPTEAHPQDPQQPPRQPAAAADAAAVYKSSVTLDSLPCEILLYIFKLIDDAPTLLRASSVCRYWHTLAFDGSLWRSLYLRRWFLGNWYFSTPRSCGDHADQSDEEDDEDDSDGTNTPLDGDMADQKESLRDYGFEEDVPYKQRGTRAVWDSGSMSVKQTADEERLFLEKICQRLLPMVGRHVRLLSLHGSTSLSNDSLRRILYLCPNIEHLSIAYTKVSTFGLDSRLHRRLTRLSASACPNISDVAVQKLIMSLNPGYGALRRMPSDPASRSCECLLQSCGSASRTLSPESGSPLSGSRRDLRSGPRLRYLDVSGCHMLTDNGLGHLISAGPYPELIHLDLSGLSRITDVAVKRLVALCHSLNPERFYYCERIPHGEDQLMKTAEMCRGICHKGISCCRFAS